MRVMNSQLKQDICEIGNPGLLNSEVADIEDRRNRLISEELWYACIHWMSHVISTQTDVEMKELEFELNEFCTRHLFHWIEALSIVGGLQSVVEQLPRVQEWYKVCIVA
jgi:hypothetical protein